MSVCFRNQVDWSKIDDFWSSYQWWVRLGDFLCRNQDLLTSHTLNANKVPVMVETPVDEVVIICVTFRVDCSTLRVDIDKPSWDPINQETIQGILPLRWPLTVFWIFKNSNFEKSWIWWPRQGIRELSEFEACKRSGVMRWCEQMSGTCSEVL